MEPRAGRLLVATPLLTEDTFWRTVVLLLQHDEDGALGVVLTRPTGTDVSEVVPGWDDAGVVLQGGPVQAEAAICLAWLAAGSGPDASYAVVPEAPWLATVDLDAPRSPAVGQVRLFAGYAGWTGGRLEAEVAEGAWWVLEAQPRDAFTDTPERLWREVLRRQEFPLSMAATYPADPTAN